MSILSLRKFTLVITLASTAIVSGRALTTPHRTTTVNHRNAGGPGGGNPNPNPCFPDLCLVGIH